MEQTQMQIVSGKSLISIDPHHQLQSKSQVIENCGIVNVMVKYWY
jgi:hypothetical protein